MARPKGPLYAHKTEGTVWTLVKNKPLTLVGTFTGEVRRPTKITFGRDYRLQTAAGATS